MNTEGQTHENVSAKSEFKGVRHTAIWFGLPAILLFNGTCLLMTSWQDNLRGLHIYTWIATAFTLFFGLCCIFKNFKFKEYSAGGWFYAVTMGITYLTCYVYLVSLIVSFAILDLWILIVIALFFVGFNINDLINTISTVKRYNRAKKCI